MDFLGADPDVDWVIEASIEAMRKAGATIVDVRYPKWLLDAKQEFYNAIRRPEFHAQIADYLKTTGPGYPKTLEEMIERANSFNAVRADGAAPNPGRWTLFKREAESGSLDDYRYTSVRDHALPMMRAAVEGMLMAQRLDAIVYPTSPRRPGLIAESGGTGAAPMDDHRRRISRTSQGFRISSCPPGSPATTCRWASRSWPGVQRTEVDRARLQLRAGDARATASRTHARPRRRIDRHRVALRPGIAGNRTTVCPMPRRGRPARSAKSDRRETADPLT